MKQLIVEEFIEEVESEVKRQFKWHRLEILFRTDKSFKASIRLQKNVFIAVRFNARNERMDFALIKNGKRIFGYDNLKEWHYHPFSDPSRHIPCGQPSIAQIIADIKKNYDLSQLPGKKRGK